jgi:hypothetical protein
MSSLMILYVIGVTQLKEKESKNVTLNLLLYFGLPCSPKEIVESSVFVGKFEEKGLRVTPGVTRHCLLFPTA